MTTMYETLCLMFLFGNFIINLLTYGGKRK